MHWLQIDLLSKLVLANGPGLTDIITRQIFGALQLGLTAYLRSPDMFEVPEVGPCNATPSSEII